MCGRCGVRLGMKALRKKLYPFGENVDRIEPWAGAVRGSKKMCKKFLFLT